MKQKQKSSIRKRLFTICAAITVALLLVIQIVFDAYIYQSVIRPGDQATITNLIISSVEASHRPAAVDAASGKVYLTDAKLVLPPPTDKNMQIVYADFGDESMHEIQVTTANIVHREESKLWSGQASPTSGWRRQTTSAVFDQVPRLQACARGVQILYSPSSASAPELQLKTKKMLANGQTLYFYTETLCESDLTPLLTYLQQIQSY